MLRNREDKKKRKKDNRKSTLTDHSTWLESDGLHSIMHGKAPSPEILDKMTKKFQENIMKSPLWDDIVKKYGLKKAKELLKEFRAELR